jgi:hypothetical protein
MTCSNAHFSRRHDCDVSRQSAITPIATVRTAGSPDRHGLDFIMQVDRHTPWPTHRIRCFLQSQMNAMLPQTAA